MDIFLTLLIAYFVIGLITSTILVIKGGEFDLSVLKSWILCIIFWPYAVFLWAGITFVYKLFGGK